jgi:hypothetical protein
MTWPENDYDLVSRDIRSAGAEGGDMGTLLREDSEIRNCASISDVWGFFCYTGFLDARDTDFRVFRRKSLRFLPVERISRGSCATITKLHRPRQYHHFSQNREVISSVFQTRFAKFRVSSI